MAIADGQLAPDFRGTSFTGETIDLADFRGKKVWLGFYRWAACPLCNLRIQEVIQEHERFAADGIQLIAVFQSPADNIAKYVGAQNPPFPLIADPDMELYERFQVQTSWWAAFYPRVFLRSMQAVLKGLLRFSFDGPKARIPADFLVDPEGLVYRAYYGDAISDHIPFEQVHQFGKDLCLDMPEQVV